MSSCPLERARDLLLDMKRKSGSPLLRADITKVLADLDEFRRSASPDEFEKWRLTHATKWNPTPRDIRVMRFWIAKGHADRDDLAALMSGDDDNPLSDEAVRAYISRLRRSLEKAKATATVKQAGKDGVYRTHDPVIQRLR